MPGAQPDRQSLLDQVRDANEQLVVSSMQAQDLADQAAAARADAETAANRSKERVPRHGLPPAADAADAVLGCAHLLGRAQLDPAGTVNAIRIIERNARAAARIIDDLLDVSRIISGNMRLDPRPVDLSAVIQEALDALRLGGSEARAST